MEVLEFEEFAGSVIKIEVMKSMLEKEHVLCYESNTAKVVVSDHVDISAVLEFAQNDP